MLQNARGTYALVMQLPAAQSLKIGQLGTFDFETGWYVYVGSAFGSGGLKSRTHHHLALRRENAKPQNKHIDKLREAVIEEIWFSYDEASLEHEWSQAIVKHFCAEVPVPGFGSSDCESKCPAHLFRLAERPVAAVLRSAFKASANPILVEFARSPQRKTVESGYDSTSLAASYHRGRRFLEELRLAVYDQSSHSPTDKMQRKTKAIERDLVARLTAAMNLDAKLYKQDRRFAVAVESLVLNCGQSALDTFFFTTHPQTLKGIMQLSRTADTRQRYRIAGVITGRFKSIAPQNGDGVFDTVAFSEIPNRLRLARGTIIKCRIALSKGATREAAGECFVLAKLTYRISVQLRKLFKAGSTKEPLVPTALRRESVTPVLDRREVRGRDVGRLRNVLKRTAKNLWDYPEMVSRGIAPTPEQRTKSLVELDWIIAEVEKIIACLEKST